MAFPETGILDDFNRGDEGPPMTDWTDQQSGLEVFSNQTRSDSGGSRSFYTANTYGPNSECYATADITSGSWGVWVRVKEIGANYDGYEGYAQEATNEVELYRIDDAGFTELGSGVAFTWANGDSLGMDIIGDALKVYVNDGGAGWVEKRSETDATYGAAGYTGLFLSDTTIRVDDFGGGTIGAVAGNPWYQYAQEQ